MNLSDRNFDDLVARFSRNIYGNAKGEVRLAVLWRHLQDALPELNGEKPLRILDAGCGLGQTGLKLAELGHELVMCDLSANMLKAAEQRFDDQCPDANVSFIHAPVQDLDADALGQFDLVLFHAVLEWLAEPKLTLEGLQRFIKPDGAISLMFYNRDALIYRNLIRGNWHKAESDDLRGEAGGLTPYNPLSLHEVESWLGGWNMRVLSRAGVRVVFDYMDRSLREKRDVAEVVRIELKYAMQEPWLFMGRYLHLIARAQGCSL